MHFTEAVDTFLAGYFATCRRSEKTQAAYRIDLAQLESHVGSTTSLLVLDAERLEAWAKEMRSRGYASVSIRRKFATARVFFAYWVRKGTLDKSPLWRIRLDLGRERVLPRSLTPVDAKSLIEEAWRKSEPESTLTLLPNDPRFLQIRNLAAIEILFATGMRVGELVTLHLDDWCEPDRAFVVKGKGSRQRLAFMPDDRSLRAVQSYLVQRKALELEHGGLLINASGRRISTQGVSRMLSKTAKAAGILTRVTPHVIRHTVGGCPELR